MSRTRRALSVGGSSAPSRKRLIRARRLKPNLSRTRLARSVTRRAWPGSSSSQQRAHSGLRGGGKSKCNRSRTAPAPTGAAILGKGGDGAARGTNRAGRARPAPPRPRAHTSAMEPRLLLPLLLLALGSGRRPRLTHPAEQCEAIRCNTQPSNVDFRAFSKKMRC